MLGSALLMTMTATMRTAPKRRGANLSLHLPLPTWHSNKNALLQYILLRQLILFPSLAQISLSFLHHFLLPPFLALTHLFLLQLLYPLSPLPLLTYFFHLSIHRPHLLPSLLSFTSILSTFFDFHHLHCHEFSLRDILHTHTGTDDGEKP